MKVQWRYGTMCDVGNPSDSLVVTAVVAIVFHWTLGGYSKMTTIYFDGFYCSRSISWKDWHAGVRMHGERFHYRRYFPNHQWLGAYRTQPFDFWADSDQLDSNAIDRIKRGLGPTDKEANPLWIAGTYEIADEKLIQSLAPDSGGGYVWVSKYTIMDDRIVGPLGDKNAITLLFNPVSKNVGR